MTATINYTSPLTKPISAPERLQTIENTRVHVIRTEAKINVRSETEIYSRGVEKKPRKSTGQ